MVNVMYDPDGSRTSYKGLVQQALPGLHDFVAEKIAQYFPEEGRVADIGSGSGAMVERLHDMRYMVWHFDPDLNGAFGECQPFETPFDALVCIEVIEHLENPRHFFRQCCKLLSPGGYILVTTPNISSKLSIARFVMSGAFQWFTYADYKREGHITPLNMELMIRAAEPTGLVLKNDWTFGTEYNPDEICIGLWQKPY